MLWALRFPGTGWPQSSRPAIPRPSAFAVPRIPAGNLPARRPKMLQSLSDLARSLPQRNPERSSAFCVFFFRVRVPRIGAGDGFQPPVSHGVKATPKRVGGACTGQRIVIHGVVPVPEIPETLRHRIVQHVGKIPVAGSAVDRIAPVGVSGYYFSLAPCRSPSCTRLHRAPLTDRA